MTTSKLDKIEVLYETDTIVAINKPAGLIVHADGVTDDPTVADWVLGRYPETERVGESPKLSSGEEVARPGIVHRLDRDTSGVLLIARTNKAHRHLKRQFKEGAIRKEYRAFVYGKIKQERGSVSRPIGRSKHDFRKRTAGPDIRGAEREATTIYNVLARSVDVTYLSVIPKTGRTHQIRVHMKAIQHPVVCDGLYAPKRDCLLGFERLALHAHTIAFTDLAGDEQAVEAPLPEDFVRAESRFKS